MEREVSERLWEVVDLLVEVRAGGVSDAIKCEVGEGEGEVVNGLVEDSIYMWPTLIKAQGYQRGRQVVEGLIKFAI